MDQNTSSLDLNALDIKIISCTPFTCILQDGTPAFQLQITLVLSEEYLGANTEPKTEEQILHKVVPPKYHEFANMFCKGSAKELPPHRLYDYKIDFKDGTSLYLARSITCLKSNSVPSKATLTICLEKASSGPQSPLPGLQYLGIIVTLDGIHIDPAKVEAILNWPPP
ncbi:hypothetical protein C0993_008206 [Termitomyces sp. T159_Od127]|nr:hypothetical protein C0993_008206 [Termitomyces sp. T159_Od127]